MVNGDGGGAAYCCAGPAMRKFDDVRDRGANVANALCAGVDVAAPFVLLFEGIACLKEVAVLLADGGGRGGSDEGAWGVAEEVPRPGGGGKAMMNGCPEDRTNTTKTYQITCQNAIVTAALIMTALCLEAERSPCILWVTQWQAGRSGRRKEKD